jgi:hypothetical protein
MSKGIKRKNSKRKRKKEKGKWIEKAPTSQHTFK